LWIADLLPHEMAPAITSVAAMKKMLESGA